MKSIKHLIGASAILMLAFAFNGCTTDSDVVQIPENELESEDISSSSNSEKAETKAKSSSSKKVEAKSSSSKKADNEKAEDADSKDKSSSSVKKDDSKVSSSSKKEDKEEAKSSSSAKKIRVPGMEATDNDRAGNTAKSSSSVKEKPQSSSSNKEAVKDTIDKDTTSVIKDNNEMDKLDSNEQEVLDSLISSGDTSITKIDSLVIDKDSLDFDNNEYLCKAPDGNWYRLNESKAKTFWKLLWDLTVYIFTGHHYYDFTKACDELYMRPKN